MTLKKVQKHIYTQEYELYYYYYVFGGQSENKNDHKADGTFMQACKQVKIHFKWPKPQFQPTKGATRSYKGIIMVFIEKFKRMKLLFELKVFSRNILRDLTYTKSALPRHFYKQLS